MPPPEIAGLGNIAIFAGMASRRQAGVPQVRPIASGRGWSASEFVCDAGPEHRPFEERHDRVTIAAVVSGSFRYRTHAGESLMHPGAFVLGARGRCYECGHDHSRGDRCISFSFDADWFDEIFHAAAGGGSREFAHAGLPASSLPPLAARVAAFADDHALATEDLAMRLAFAVIKADAGARPTTKAVTARDEKRVAAALRYIEENCAEAIDLDALAAVACVSKFHFLRLFRRVAGVSPYRFLLDARLRRAAAQIAVGERRISEVAFEAGFGDLSTFNARFRATFGDSPSGWRRARGGSHGGGRPSAARLSR